MDIVFIRSMTDLAESTELMIYTDCSFLRKFGSWSVLFHTADEPLIISGISPEYISTAAQGEAYAIFKAVTLAKQLFPEQKNLKIFTDCIGLCFVLARNARPQRNSVNRMIQQGILKLLLEGGYEWDVSFVPSHQKGTQDLSIVYNNLVDAHAKKIRRKNQSKGDVVFRNKSRRKKVSRWITESGLSHPLFFKILEFFFSPQISPEHSQLS
jgi:hypothetical protein